MNLHIKKGMIDSHFHTQEMIRKGIDVHELLGQLASEGMDYLLDAGVQLGDFEQRMTFLEDHKGLFLAAGIHPNIPSGEWPEDFQEILAKQANHPSVKALGETGLDFFREYSCKKDQYTLLDLHYALSKEVKKPLIFHCRSAEKELSEWISERDFPFGAVLHCFPGDPDLGRLALEKGFMISLAGNSTFKNAKNIRDTLDWIPLEQLLIETDSPYLSPHPKRGKVNHPGRIGYIYEMVAEIKGIPLCDLIDRINRNFKIFIDL